MTKCPNCGVSDALVEIEAKTSETLEIVETDRGEALSALDVTSGQVCKISTGRAAWDFALGGGLVCPSSVLVMGSRGVGKSTSSLRIASRVARELGAAVLYVSAEMPAGHVRRLADDLRLSRRALGSLFIQESPELGDALRNIERIKPAVVVWDSIQRIKIRGELGGVELRRVVVDAIESSQRHNHVAILLSQVTKQDGFSGDAGIGHDVDVIVDLHKSGENLIAIECDKNRFAATPLRAEEALRA